MPKRVNSTNTSKNNLLFEMLKALCVCVWCRGGNTITANDENYRVSKMNNNNTFSEQLK